jgi:hypothetical protein
MAKITPRKNKETISVKTLPTVKQNSMGYKWWDAGSKREMAEQMLSSAIYLKEQQQYRYRQSAIYARLYGNMPLNNFAGSGLNRMSMANNLPVDRPTMNVVQSCVDTLVSRISQSRPRPIFLTDNGNYKERNLAKQLNTFLMGEFYSNKAYAEGELILRDAAVLGAGCLKVYEDNNNRVAIERVLLTELLVDENEASYGNPRQLYQFKLVDRSVLISLFPEHKSEVNKAEQAFPDTTGQAERSVADQVMVVEGWHLPSGPNANDGKHVIACSSGMLFEEDWNKDCFPFVFMQYSPRIRGFWGQGLAEQLMGTQTEINKLLMTISASINLVGVPRVFVEDGSKVVKAHLNNQIGAIVTYQGQKPVYEVAPCVPAELYAQLERLIQYSYQQSGVSALAATSQKPAGLNSGEAIRNYDDLQSDRFAALSRRYDEFYVALAYQVIELAKEIADRDGTYSTVYPNKNGTKEIDLPKADMLEDTYVIQCYDASSLPRSPAGRLQTVTEMMQAGLISPQEGRRLLDYPDIEQVDKLDVAAEERILQILDQIIDEGKYTPPDPFMDLELANKLVTQYYNLYSTAKLEEEKSQMLRDFFTQVQTLKQVAMQAMAPQGQPMAVPQAAPVSEMLPNVPQ